MRNLFKMANEIIPISNQPVVNATMDVSNITQSNVHYSVIKIINTIQFYLVKFNIKMYITTAHQLYCGTQAVGGTVWSCCRGRRWDGLVRCSRNRTAVTDDGPESPGNSDHGLTLDVVMIVRCQATLLLLLIRTGCPSWRVVVCPVHEASWPGSRALITVLMLSCWYVFLLNADVEWMNDSDSLAKPSQAKVLTGGGDLREAQVERPPVC